MFEFHFRKSLTKLPVALAVLGFAVLPLLAATDGPITDSCDATAGADDGSPQGGSTVVSAKPSPTAGFVNDALAPDPVSDESRWFHLTLATIGTRMRYSESSNKAAHGIYQQHKEEFAGYFKFDEEGKYTIHAVVSSGYYFTRSYAETGAGQPWYQERGANLFLRELYFQAQPVHGVELQYGSLPILRGAVSENISYDEDGYIDGERLNIRRPHDLYFDDISVTYAYIGDYELPNMFRRLDRFRQSNYHQFLVAKKLSSRLSMSVDLTHHGWSETVRAGAIVDTHESKIFDSLRLGVYDRYSNEDGQGVEATAQKHFGRRLTLMGGWVSVDVRSTDLVTPYDLLSQRKSSMTLGYAPGGSLNADRFARGHSPYLNATYKINSFLSFNVFAKNDVDPDPHYTVKNAKVVLAGFDCDLRPILRPLGIR